MLSRALSLVVCLGLAAHFARAQDARYLVPSRYASPVGERVELSLRESRGADASVAWDDERIAWSLVRVAGTQENSDRAPRAGEDAPAGTVRIATDGAAVIGVDFKARVVNLDGVAMRKLVGDAGARKAPAGGAAVRVVQSAKTVIRVGESEPGQSGNVTSKTGQQVELRPTFDPTGVGIGSDVPVVVYAGDGKAPGARLVATHVTSGERQEFAANAGGVGTFRLSRAGVWRVECRHLVEVKGKKDGEWVLYTATLTFDARDGQGGVK